MRKYFLLILMSFWGLISLAQNSNGKLPDVDKELLSNMYRIMRLPEGVHKIYDGTGSSVFDILYTIDISDNKWVIYKGGAKNHFDIMYSLVCSGNTYKIYKGSSNSSFDVIYTFQTTNKGYSLYKGDSTFSFDLLYSYERN